MTYFGFYGQSVVNAHWVSVAASAFFAATFLLSPDLDLKYSIPTKNWGVFKFIWYGYSRLFRHRGHSHSLVLSLLTKLGYLSVSLLILFGLFKLLIGLTLFKNFTSAMGYSSQALSSASEKGVEFLVTNKKDLFAALFGAALSDWAHILSDRFISSIKNYRNN